MKEKVIVTGENIEIERVDIRPEDAQKARKKGIFWRSGDYNRMKYTGNKSSDAEIDLVKGTVNFDYSLNRFEWSGNSNSSCILQKEKRKISIIESLLAVPYVYIAIFASMAMIPIVQKFISQYTSQKIALWGMKYLHGLQEQQIIGKQETKNVSFFISKNLWFEYELDGDYSNKIHKIELRRRFIKRIYWFGSCFKQQGWNVIFTFIEPPQYGNVVLRSVL